MQRSSFTLSYPALLAGIDLLSGAAAALTGDLYYILIPLCIHALLRLHLYRGILFFLFAYAYTLLIYPPIFPRSQPSSAQQRFLSAA